MRLSGAKNEASGDAFDVLVGLEIGADGLQTCLLLLEIIDLLMELLLLPVEVLGEQRVLGCGEEEVPHRYRGEHDHHSGQGQSRQSGHDDPSLSRHLTSTITW